MFNLIPELVQVIHAACEISILCNLLFVQRTVFPILIVNPVRIDGVIFPVNDSEHKTAFIDFQYCFACCGITLVFHGINLPFMVELGTETRYGNRYGIKTRYGNWVRVNQETYHKDGSNNRHILLPMMDPGNNLPDLFLCSIRSS